ncbi:MAG: hypothetical protein QME07_05305 [bacterium]|nr:hypothetical protein [bacterium]
MGEIGDSSILKDIKFADDYFGAITEILKFITVELGKKEEMW